MSRRAVLLTVGAAGAALALAGCGSSSAASGAVPTPSGSAVTLSSDPATCTKAATTSACTVRVWYTNVSNASVDVDPTSTRLVDANGAAYLPVAQGDVPAGAVPAGHQVFVVWTLALPSTSSLAAVTWLGADGRSQTAALALADTGSSPSPTPSASVAPAVKPTPKPTPTPVATKKATTSTSTGSRSGGGSSSGGGSGSRGGSGSGSTPPASGTIG